MIAPPYPQSIVDVLAAAGERPVFEHGDRIVSGADLLDTIRRTSAGLRSAGVGPGVGVAMVLGVSPEAFAAIVAAHVVGARVAGVRPSLTPDQLRYVLHQDISAVVVDSPTALLRVREAAPADARPLAVGPVPGLPDLLTVPGDGALLLAGRPDDVGRIIYTSGSTGEPKACARTYAALAAEWRANPDRWPPAVREHASRLRRLLVYGSLSGQMMMGYGVLALAAGGTIVVADPAAREPFLPAAIARHAATATLTTVPRLYATVKEQRERPVDLGSLQALLVYGSPLQPHRLAEALAVLGPVVFPGYGQAETGMIAMLSPAEMATSPDVLASVGRPPDMVTVQVRDPAGRPVPSGVDGEIWVRTPTQSCGYWGDPEQTAEVFVDGWVRTRDLGCLDAGGYLHLVGRTRDVVIVNANVYYTGAIERALAAHPAVAEAYVVGVLDEQTGEAPHAFVVLAEGDLPPVEALRRTVAERLGDDCVPRTVTVLDQVPVAASGKPDKRRLAAAVATVSTGTCARSEGADAGL